MVASSIKSDSGEDVGGAEIARKRKRRKPTSPSDDSIRQSSSSPPGSPSPGCVVCGKDDDHSRTLVCDGCNGEYHTYCLVPALTKIPQNDWYCDRCQPKEEGDGLDELVSALPEDYVRRFGEIVWAQGGTGYGWWPSCIFDPRLTVGTTRDLACKNLGRKHLVYFFQCEEAPFSVLHNSKIQDWDVGLVDSLYLGKAARANGKARYIQFREAHQAAILEEGKPRDERLQFGPPGRRTPSPTKALTITAASPMNHSVVEEAQTNKSNRPKRSNERRRIDENADVSKKQKREIPVAATTKTVETRKRPARVDVSDAEFRGGRGSSAFQRLESPKKKLFCSVNCTGPTGASINLGFVRIDSTRDSTFAHVRKVIASDLDEVIPASWEWRFFVPTLGRVSLKQETVFGAMLPFLREAKCADGQGTMDSPIKLELKGNYVLDLKEDKYPKRQVKR